MTQSRGCTATLAALSCLGFSAVSIVHALWAAGSPWPARNERDLAQAVVGSDQMPAPAASATVAVSAAGAALCVAGVGGQRPVAVAARRLIGAGLLVRGLVGGVVAARVLKLPEPGSRFRRLDTRFYRPLCVALGVATIGASRRPAEPAP